MKRARIEFWWFAERMAGKVWLFFCPPDRVAYWLDWLPAYCYRHRKQAER